MNELIQLTIAAAVAVYIVEVSGFTEAWRGLIARRLGITEKALRPLPPFDCGKCAAFWTCIIFSAVDGSFSLVTVAWAALMSLLALPAGQLMELIRDTASVLLSRLGGRLG